MQTLNSEEKESIECPCEVCLVRATCGNKMCEKGHLIIAYARECPMADKYLDNVYKRKMESDYYTRIYKMCHIFGVKKNFVWHASSVALV